MKRLFIILLLPLCSMRLSAQNEDPIQRIYERYAGEKVSFAFNLDAGIFDGFDFDLDTDEMEQHIEGTVERVRLIHFEEYNRALRSEKEIVNELFDLGYEAVDVPRDWEDDDSQILIFRLKNQRVSPYLILIHNDRRSQDASIVILSGAITYKSEVL